MNFAFIREVAIETLRILLWLSRNDSWAVGGSCFPEDVESMGFLIRQDIQRIKALLKTARLLEQIVALIS